MKNLTSAQGLDSHTDPAIMTIDVRPVDAYNGWCMENAKRGGHIPGAKSLPVHWSDYMDWIEIVESKGITRDHELIIYGYHEKDALKIAGIFYKAGYRVLGVFNQFIGEWSVNPDFPLEKLEKYRQLAPPEWLHDLISGKNPLH